MTKQELTTTFYSNHLALMNYVSALPDEKFIYRNEEKWTAGQQLSHTYLCLLPFLKVLPSKASVLRFGRINRKTWSYETVIEKYLQTDLKAPGIYLPEPVESEQKALINASLQQALDTIVQLLEPYTEEELDHFVLPHPLLGPLTVREMFYLMAYHPLHHLRQAKANLINLDR